MIGKQISHYKITEKLGEGGMGAVYKALDTKLKRTVALKFLPVSLSADKEARTRFIKEAQTASALDHPNICTIHEIGETPGGQSFIAMACYEGQTLKEKIKDQRLKIEDATSIIIQVAKGLARAHEEGIIHRDIKPANIMITDRGEVKILDFGLAKLAGQTRLTRTGTTLGTVAYMSPEQARGEEADRRSDIWSLGVVLYEMLSGQLPFKGEFDQAMIYTIINEEPAELIDLVDDVPPELVQIVKKSLSKDLNQRYQSIDEMLEDFKPLSSEAATIIQEPFSKSIARLWRRKKTRRWAISLAGIFLLVITLLISRPFIFKDASQAKPVPIAIISFENQTGDNAYDYLQKAIPNLLITSLEQLGGLQVATWERLLDLSKQAGEENIDVIDRDLGFELCRMDDISSIVLGSFTRAGDVFATDVKVLDVRNKRLLKSASAQGEGIASILKTQIDELTWNIALGMGLDEADISSEQKSVAAATTSSMEAYNYFIRGKEEYNKINDVDAARFLERAVQLDSAFAIAYLYLGNAYHRGPFSNAEAINMLKKAKKYSVRATQKEKLFIDAMYAIGIERKPDKYFHILKKLTALYPDEKDAHHDLGNYYYGHQQYQKAVVEFNNALKLDPTYGRTLNILGYTYIKLKDYQQAINCFEKYAAAYPGEPNPFDSLADLYFFLGRLDEALAKSKEALTVKPDFASWIKAAYINAMREEYDETMKWIDYHIDNSKLPVEISYGYRWKAYFHYWLGDFQASIADITKSKPVPQKTDRDQMNLGYSDHTLGWIYYDRKEFDLSRDHYRKWYEAQSAYARKRQHPSLAVAYNFFLGLLDLREGRLDSAKSRVTKISVSSPEVISFQRDRAGFLHNLLQAEIALAEGAVEKAIKIAGNLSLPEKQVHMYPETLLLSSLPRRDVLARAYQMNGDLNKAIAEYERLLTPDLSGQDIFLIHPKYHYYLAKLYEKSGKLEKTVPRYKKFLDIWQNADPDIPELIDAKKRLAILTNTK